MEIFRGGSGDARREERGEENRMNWRGTTSPTAAFFDLDGTLTALPSLERRFLGELRKRGAIPARNYFLWLARALWLAPRGIAMIRHGNKMYLRGLCASGRGARKGGQPPRQGSGQAKMAVPRLFPEGVDQVAWHARKGHSIVLVSGTLAPLAQEMALALVVRLAVRGIATSVAVCATHLEEKDGRWTGQIIGDAMFGEAKGRAVRRLAKEKSFDLARCYAYGDGLSDRWMLEAVGRACVVNPSAEMQELARRKDWPTVRWHDPKMLTERSASELGASGHGERAWEKAG